MAASIICATCVRLWGELGDATIAARAAKDDRILMLKASKARKAATEAIRIHEDEMHSDGVVVETSPFPLDSAR